jgi:membrane protein DedA with SNARE-associated domain/rhodanese-related sulfurtransferase
MEAILEGLAAHGVSFVGINVLLQQLGLPIPSVPTMVVAGSLAAMGKLNGLAVFAVCVLASVFADTLWFLAGRRYGYPVLKFLCKVSLSPDTCVRQTEGIFERYGFYSLVGSKFVPGFSTVAPPIAGALKMPVAKFLLAAVASAGLWVGAAMGFGLVFAHEVELALAWMSRNAGLAGTALGTAFALYIAYKAWQRWKLARFVQSARISVDELHERMGSEEKPLVVDIGSRLAQQARPHIPGAKLMDLDDVARHAETFPVDREIVFYCHCPNEASAKRAAQILLAKGFKRVRPLIGGIDAWIEAGRAVEHGVPAVFVRR